MLITTWKHFGIQQLKLTISMIQLRIPFEIKNPFLPIFNDDQKRLRWKFSVINSKASNLLANTTKDDFIIVLDIYGQEMGSVEFSSLITSHLAKYKNIIFIIGGDTGIDEQTRNAADFKISFGRHTWPHQLCSVMLIEQIYRAEMIANHHPYHK